MTEAAVVRKQFIDAESRALSDGLFEVTISTETVDRDGDVVIASGGEFENYLKNPVVLWAHDYEKFPIGQTRSVDVAGGKVTASFEFAPTSDGQTARTLWEGGFLSATSIGFLPLVYESEHREDGTQGNRYDTWELVEFSIVPVPANPEALRRTLVKALKDYGSIDDIPTVLRDLVDAVVRGAIPSHHTDTVDSSWDGPAAMAACDAKASALRKLCAWVDSTADPELKGSYKFPHHDVSGGAPGPANLPGVRNSLARLPNSSIPEDDMPGVARHLHTHLDDSKKTLAPHETEAPPGSLVVEAAAEGDVAAVRLLVGDLTAALAGVYDAKAEEAEAPLAQLDTPTCPSLQTEITAPAEQHAAPEPSTAKSGPTHADIARIAAKVVDALTCALTGKLPD